MQKLRLKAENLGDGSYIVALALALKDSDLSFDATKRALTISLFVQKLTSEIILDLVESGEALAHLIKFLFIAAASLREMESLSSSTIGMSTSSKKVHEETPMSVPEISRKKRPVSTSSNATASKKR